MNLAGLKKANKKSSWRNEKLFVDGKQHIPSTIQTTLAQTTFVMRCWNANGDLAQRGKDHALQELFDSCDIVCLTKTHCLAGTDCIAWPGYVWFSASRRKFVNRPAGGIAMYVTDSLCKHCTAWKYLEHKFARDSSYMWVKLYSRAGLFDICVCIAVCCKPPKTGLPVQAGLASRLALHLNLYLMV